MTTAYFLATTLTLLVTLVLAQDDGHGQEGELQVTTSNAVDVTDDGIFDDELRSYGGDMMLFGSANSRHSCIQRKRCKKRRGTCQPKGTCTGKAARGCYPGCSCCLPIPTADQCAEEDGFCLETGDRCNGTIKDLHNTCKDHCTCCLPDKQECVSPWTSIGSSTGCFLFVQELVDWDSARTECQNKGGDLAILDVESKRIDMVNYMELSGLKNTTIFWLGGNDRSGSWLWLNDNPITEGWKVGQEPDDDAGDDTCVYIYTKPYPSGRYDLLFDYFCTYTKGYFVCEK